MPVQLKEIYHILLNPDVYLQYNVDLPKGILLYGSPGTGKTHFARILASMTNSSFFYISASAFDEIYVGQGAQRVRNLFAEARDSLKPPSFYERIFGNPLESPKHAIIFIDEIDSLGNRDSVGNSSSYSTLSELLTCLDGLNSSKNIFVIGATNKLNTVDAALRRSGRFDRVCEVKLPNKKSRKHLMHFFLHDKPGYQDNLRGSDYLKELLIKTDGFSIADLKNLCNEAVLNAIRETISTTDQAQVPLEPRHIEQAFDLLKVKVSTEKPLLFKKPAPKKN
jgi:cell division protease FtsH